MDDKTVFYIMYAFFFGMFFEWALNTVQIKILKKHIEILLKGRG